MLLKVSTVKQASFKPISSNVDVDLDSFKQPLLRYLAHYFLQIPMYVAGCVVFSCAFLRQNTQYGFQATDRHIWKYCSVPCLLGVPLYRASWTHS